jgi:type IV pilus assembly protein PilB
MGSGSSETDARSVLEALERYVATRSVPTPALAARPCAPEVVFRPRHSGRLLGNLLVTRGYIVDSDLEYALAHQARVGARLGEIVVRLGLISDRALVEVLAEQLRMPIVDIAATEIDRATARRLPSAAALRLHAVPIRMTDGSVDVAIADPTDDKAVDELVRTLGGPVRLLLATAAGIDAAIHRVWGLQRPTLEPVAVTNVDDFVPAR